MRFLCMHKAGAKDEAGIPPPPELIAGMGQLIGEAAASGTFLAGEGLRPSSTRFRLDFRAGGCEVRQGPFTGENDLPQRLVILKVDSTEAAIDWARRFGQAAGATRLELGPLTEPWDLGMMPKPPGKVPLRFLLLQQATAASEAGTPPAAAQLQAIRSVLAAMQQAGVLVFSETLLPSKKGAMMLACEIASVACVLRRRSEVSSPRPTMICATSFSPMRLSTRTSMQPATCRCRCCDS